MSTYEELAALERALRDEHVLSVYVDGRASDPASRDRWRHDVEADLRALHAAAGRTPAERDAFDRAAAHLREQLPPAGAAVGARGWVGFVTASGAAHVAALPVTVTTRVTWSVGPHLAPYMRTLEELRPVAVAVADAVSTRLYRHRGGTLEAVDVVSAERHDRPPSHMGSMPRVGFHTGTRGAPGVDEAERRRLEALGHMARAVAARLVALAGADGWIVVGGTPEAARAVRQALPAALATRATTLHALHDGASEAEIARAAVEGATSLRDHRDLAALDALFEHAVAAGRAALGVEATRRSLADRAVQKVFFTPTFLTRAPGAAEAVVRGAFAQHAAVAEVTGDAAERLDRDAGGIAARLRYGRAGAPGVARASAAVRVDARRARRGAPVLPVPRTPGSLAPTLVVCAASAGGIPALRQVLSALPSDLPAAVAIVLHRAPTRPSMLARVLAPHSALPVLEVDSSDWSICPGVVYLAPPDRHLVVTAFGRFGVTDGHRIRHVRSSANPLFDSAAKVYGGRLIAVVLTGGDSDATDGVQAVRATGGTVIAQDPATALASGMPQAAIASGVVNAVLPLGEIGPAIVRLVGQCTATSEAPASVRDA